MQVKPMIILAEGPDWDMDPLMDLCSRHTRGDDERAGELGEAVINRFEELCEQRGIIAAWLPFDAEVVGPAGQTVAAEALEMLREQAMERVLGVSRQ
jgi:hypothetical protein